MLYIGINLPLSAQCQTVWDAVSGPSGEPGSWGGHCVIVSKYDEKSLTCVTWGAAKKMTNAFWDKYVDEAYAILGVDWVGAKGSPDGFNLDQLRADLQLIK